MRVPFSFLFLLLVLAEIAVFILVGETIGVLATLGLTVFGMVAGALLLRWQGMATLMRARTEIEAGRTPAASLAEGAVLAVAALLIVLPGFITDFAGALLFVPLIRRALWRKVGGRIKLRTASPANPPTRRAPVIDLEQSEYGASPRPDSPWRHNRGPEA